MIIASLFHVSEQPLNQSTMVRNIMYYPITVLVQQEKLIKFWVSASARVVSRVITDRCWFKYTQGTGNFCDSAQIGQLWPPLRHLYPALPQVLLKTGVVYPGRPLHTLPRGGIGNMFWRRSLLVDEAADCACPTSPRLWLHTGLCMPQASECKLPPCIYISRVALLPRLFSH